MTEITKISLRVTWIPELLDYQNEILDWLIKKSDSYVVAMENEESNCHWHACIAVRYTSIPSFRAAFVQKFPQLKKLGNAAYSMKSWRDEGGLRYICKGSNPQTPPHIVCKQMIDFDPVALQKAWYAFRELSPAAEQKDWFPALLTKLRKQKASFSTPAETHKIFIELTKVCPGVTKHQIITYMLKLRRALDKDDYDDFMWRQVSMDVC